MDTAVIDISESSSPTASRRRVGRTIAISAAVAACLLAVLAVAHRSSREVREDAANTSIMGGFAKEGMLDLGEIVVKFGDTMGKFNTDPNFNFAEEGGSWKDWIFDKGQKWGQMGSGLVHGHAPKGPPPPPTLSRDMAVAEDPDTSMMGFVKEGASDLGEIIGMFGDTMLSGATDPDFNLADTGLSWKDWIIEKGQKWGAMGKGLVKTDKPPSAPSAARGFDAEEPPPGHSIGNFVVEGAKDVGGISGMFFGSMGGLMTDPNFNLSEEKDDWGSWLSSTGSKWGQMGSGLVKGNGERR